MRRLLVVLMTGVFLLAGLASLTFAQEKKAKEPKPAKAATAKEFRWHGRVVRFNKDAKTIDVERKNVLRTVVYDDSTKWTERNKPLDGPKLQDGSIVIALGTLDDKGRVIAKRIDLRTP